MNELIAPFWNDYELIDCGNFEKLERFGNYTLIRPEPQALWDRKLPEATWLNTAHARYKAKTSTSGEWERFKEIKAPWIVKFEGEGFQLKFYLKFTAFKHVGLFPEQAANWNYLYRFLKSRGIPNPKVLNLFAYTGGASLAAKSAGADTIHLDSVKQVVNWSRENMELSGLKDIRWVVEDAMKFAAREAKRGNKYHAIIMDPPSYGLGPSGERWKLEDHLNEMLKNVIGLLDEKAHCFIINTYSLNLSSLVLKNLVESETGQLLNPDYGELCLESKQKVLLPLGSYFRFDNLPDGIQKA
jgi:23S rRNA (cytosine1962-C5)-methyltransferase